MRHLIYIVSYSVVPTNSYQIRTTLGHKDTKYSAPFMTLQPSLTVHSMGQEVFEGAVH